MLGALSDIDVSNEAFPYLGARTGMVAGVPSMVMRIGFVGELGYEIHHPAAAAEEMWTALLEAARRTTRARPGSRPSGGCDSRSCT